MKINCILEWLEKQNYAVYFEGDKECQIEGFSSLNRYQKNTITWIKNKDSFSKAAKNVADDIACAVLQNGVECQVANVIVSEDSKGVFFEILRHFWGNNKESGSIGEGTILSGDIKVDDTTVIGYNCSITGNIVIGKECLIENNVVIQGNVIIGNRCHIQSGVVIGIDGYGYSQEAATKKKTMIEHFGGVSIGNDVFIGSHVNIARGTIDDTVIGNGVKIAPSTHIGHNNVIGNDTAVICSVLYGSVNIGERAYITASAVANQISIGSDTVVGMGSVVTKHLDSKIIAYGVPAIKKRDNDSKL